MEAQSLCSVSLREISPGADNHCLFHAVAAGLGGRTHQQMRVLLRCGVQKLDSVHMLTRYDLFREEGTDGSVTQRPHELAEVYARRQLIAGMSSSRSFLQGRPRRTRRSADRSGRRSNH